MKSLHLILACLTICFMTNITHANTSVIANTKSTARGTSSPVKMCGTCPCDVKNQIADIQKKAKDSRKQMNESGQKPIKEKIMDLSCITDLWSGANFPGLGDLMGMMKQKACEMGQDMIDGAVSGAQDSITGMVNGAIDTAMGTAGNYLTKQTEALTGGLQSNLELANKFTSKNQIKREAKVAMKAEFNTIKSDYKNFLYD